MKNRTFKLSALSAGVAMALGSLPAAQAQEEDTVEEIVVTGSHVRRSEYEGKAPIQIVDAATIELIGAAQPVEMLKQLSVNSGSQFYGETNDRAGVSQFNIRNLGLGSTLTLINGKRAGIAAVADASGTDFLDINQLPLTMVSRIDVLTDGASPIYGSQAVAGVANIITRKGFEGLELSGGVSTATMDAWWVGFASGTGYEHGNFNVYGSYYQQGHNERSEFGWMQDRLVGNGDISRSRFLSSTGSPGTYRRANINPLTNEAVDARIPNPAYDPNDPDSAEFLVAGNNPDADCQAAGGVQLNPADIGGIDSSCRYHFVDQVSVISREERAQLFTEFDWNFNDTVRYYFEGGFSNAVIKRDNGGATLNTGRAGGGGFTIASDHPFNFYVNDPNDGTALVYIGPENWDNNIHTAADLRAIARPLGSSVNNNEFTEQDIRDFNHYRALNGVEIALPGDWLLDTSFMWAKNTLTSRGSHTYRSDEFQDQVRQGIWNPFGSRIATPNLVSPKDGVSVSGDTSGQTDWDQIGVATASAESKVFDLIATGNLWETSWGPIGAAAGFQYRDTTYIEVGDSLSNAGLANEASTSRAIYGDQDVTAFYAEVLVPVTDMASFQLAVRNEDYGDGVSTTDPKLGFEVLATEWLAFRGSWGTSFQAPTVRQTAEATSSAFLDDPASPTGPSGSLQCVSTGLNNNVAVVVKGAPDLKPQESEAFTLGAVFTMENFQASIDYWDFDYKQLIASSEGPQAIVNNDCLDDGVPNDPRVTRDAGGQLRQVDTQFVNIGQVATSGIDLKADYSWDLNNSQILFNFIATYVDSFAVDTDGDGVTEFDGAGSRNFSNSFSTMPQWRGLLGGTWFAGNHSVNVTARYIDGYTNDQSSDLAGNGAPISDWTTLDAQYSIVIPELLGGGDTVFTLGVNNIFDEDPPALRRLNDDGSLVERFKDDGTYERGWVDRPGYDDRSGVDLRGRIVYFRFKQNF